MSATFTGDRDIQLTVGDWRDGQTVLFERRALERLVALASEILAIPLPDDAKAELPVLVSPVG